MSQSVAPIANVSVSKQLVGRACIKPDMGAESRLHIVDPVAGVLLVRSDPPHDAVTVTLVVVPVALVVVPSLVGHLALALLHAFGPLALVDGAIFVTQFTVTVAHAVNPLTLVFNALLLVDINTLSMSEAVHYLTLVGGAIGPLIASPAGNFVLAELTLVNGVVSPLECTFSVEQTMSQFSLVLVAIFKNTGALTVVYFANLIAKTSQKTEGHLPSHSFGSQSRRRSNSG